MLQHKIYVYFHTECGQSKQEIRIVGKFEFLNCNAIIISQTFFKKVDDRLVSIK